MMLAFFLIGKRRTAQSEESFFAVSQMGEQYPYYFGSNSGVYYGVLLGLNF